MSTAAAAAPPPSPITVTPSPAAASPSSLAHQFLPTIIIILLIVIAVVLILYFRRLRLDGATTDTAATASPSSIRRSLPADSGGSSLHRASTAAGDGRCAVCLSELDRRDRKLLPACCHAFHPNCAVCLSELDRRDRKLLPACCHAFHPNCIDAWLLDNRTCPVCRSDAVEASDSDAASLLHRGAEVGSVVGSSRHRMAVPAGSGGSQRINHSASFSFSGDGEQSETIGSRSASEVSGRFWLQDYLFGRVQSFRTAFAGSSRRSQVADLGEAEAGEGIIGGGEQLSSWLL